jgi:hypothetical protein
MVRMVWLVRRVWHQWLERTIGNFRAVGNIWTIRNLRMVRMVWMDRSFWMEWMVRMVRTIRHQRMVWVVRFEWR